MKLYYLRRLVVPPYLKNTDTGGGIAMIVFNTRYGFMRWSAYFSLCMWRLRLKIRHTVPP